METLFKTSRQCACELFTSGICNLACSYCYIPKNDEMMNIHNEILDKIDSGIYISELYELYGDNLTHLSFWGTEPTLTLLKVKNIIPQLVNRFPKLKSFSFSTNMIAPPRILVEFLRSVAAMDKSLSVDIQVSIDGPPEITDKNRFGGSVSKIKENLIDFLRLSQDENYGKLNISICSKPTWNESNLEWFAEEISRLYGYYFFFDYLIDAIKCENKNPAIDISKFSSLPSLVVPGKYTTHDGKTLNKVFRQTEEIERINQQRKIFLHNHGWLNAYKHRLKRLFDFGEEIYTKPEMFTCSGGDSNWQLGVDNDLHICHRSLFLNRKEYLNEVFKNKDIDSWDVSNFEHGKISVINDKFIASTSNQDDVTRFVFTMGSYHNYILHRISTTSAMIYELSKAGQISEEYLQNESLTALASIFMNTALSCPMENVINVGSLHASPVSMYRLFLNGAFEFMLQSVSKELKLEQ